MAGAASAPAQSHGTVNIPKIKKRTFKDSIQHVSLSNRDVQNLLQDVSKNCLDVNFIKETDILQVSMVHSANLQSLYVQKRAEMKESGRSVQTLTDQLGFRATNPSEKQHIAKEGLCVGDKFSKLGKGDCGVYLTRYFDVEVKYAWLRGFQTVEIFIFKYFTGKCKSVNVGNIYDNSSNIEPTPNFDSHVGNTLPNLNDRPYVQMSKSSIYLYEYTDECVPAKYPRHCLPYAIIKVRKKILKETVRPANIARTIPSSVGDSESPCDKPPSSPSAETSKVILNSKASSTIAPSSASLSACKKLDSPRQSSSESDAKGSVNVSNRPDSVSSHTKSVTTQNVRCKENHTNDIDGVEGNQKHTLNGALDSTLSRRDKKAKLPSEGSKISLNELNNQHMNTSQSELQNQYMKRFAAASEKIQAEKNSKMLECLKFIPSSEPDDSASPNSSSTSYVTKASIVGLPRTENNHSKCSPSAVPNSYNSQPHADRCGGRTQMFNRHTLHMATGYNSTTYMKDSLLAANPNARNHPSFAGNCAEKTFFQRSASTNEGGHGHFDNTSCLWNQSIDPRLFKRSQSSSTGTSNNSTVNRNEARAIPIKSALKKVNIQNTVKRKMSYSEYKQLKAQQQPDSELTVSVNNDVVVHETSTTVLRASNTNDCNSQNSNSAITHQSQCVVSHQLSCQTATIEDKLPNSNAEKVIPVSAAALHKLTSHSDKQIVSPSAKRNRGCESVCPVSDRQAAEMPLQETATVQVPNKTTNIFNSFINVNFQWVVPSTAAVLEADNTLLNLDIDKKQMKDIEKQMKDIEKVSESNIFSKTSISVSDLQTADVQKAQLREHDDSGLENITVKPKVVTHLQIEHGDNMSHSTERQLVETVLLPVSCAPCSDSDPVVEAVLLPLSCAPGSDSDADRNNHRKTAQAEPTNQADKHYPQCESFHESVSVPESWMDSKASLKSQNHVTSEIEDANKLVTLDCVPINSATVSMNQQTIIAPTPWRCDEDLTSSSEDSESLGDEDDSDVEGNKQTLGQLFQDGFATMQREQYGEKPLPKSISMREAGIECYLLALSDMDYQPLAIVVDYIEAKCKKDCKICEHPRQNVPEKYLAPVHSCIETTEQTSVIAALPDTTLEVKLGVEKNSCKVSSLKTLTVVSPGEDSVQLPVTDKYGSDSLNQPSEASGEDSVQLPVTDKYGSDSLNQPSEASGEDSVQLPVKDKYGSDSLNQPSEASGEDSVQLPVTDKYGSDSLNQPSEASGEDSVQLPVTDKYSSDSLNQPSEAQVNACSQPGISAITNSLRSASFVKLKIVRNQPSADSSRMDPSGTQAVVSLADPSDDTCSKSQPKSKSCSANTEEAKTLSSLASLPNSALTVIPETTRVNTNNATIAALTVASGASKDVPKISQKSSNKISLVAAYSDTDTCNSDEEKLSAKEATEVKSSSQSDIISTSLSTVRKEEINQRSLRDTSDKNAQPHAPKTSSGGRELDVSKSHEAFSEYFLEETYHMKGSLERKVVGNQNIFVDASKKKTGPHIQKEKSSSSMECDNSKFNEDAIRDHLLEETYHVKGSLDRKVVRSQNVFVDASKKKTGPHIQKEKSTSSMEGDNLKLNEDAIRDHLLEETYHVKGSLDRKVASQKVLIDASNRKTGPYTLKEKASSRKLLVKDSSSDKETARKHLVENLCHVKQSFENKNIISQQVVKDASNMKIETLAIRENTCDNRECQDVIDSKTNTPEGILPRTRCKSRSRSPNEHKRRASCDQSVHEQNPTKLKNSALSNTLTENRNDLSDEPVPTSRPDLMKPEIHAKISSLQTFPDRSLSESVPATVSSYLTCKQNVPPEVAVIEEVQSITRKNSTLDSQPAHFAVQKKETGSIDTEAPISVTKVEEMETVAKYSPDKRHLQVQKVVPTSSDSMTGTSSEDSVNSQAMKRDDHIMPNNSTSRVKFFLDKVKEGVEVKKHIDEEVLAFQKLISCEETNRNFESETNRNSEPITHEETNRNSESITHKPAVLQDMNKKHFKNASYPSCTSCENVLTTDTHSREHPDNQIANHMCSDQNKEASITETNGQNVSQVCVGSTVAAFIHSQDQSKNPSVLSAPAEVGKDSLMSTRKIETYITNNLFTASASSRVDNLMLEKDRESLALCQYDIDYRVQRNFAMAADNERSLLQQFYEDEDFRTQTSTRQNFPAMQQTLDLSNQERFSTNYFTKRPFLWGQGIQNPTSHAQYHHPHTQTYPNCPQQTYPNCPQQTRIRLPSALISVPVVDLNNTLMVDQDYRYGRREGQMLMPSTNAALLGCHKPPETGVISVCAAAPVRLPVAGRQCNLPAGNYSIFSNDTETMKMQKPNASTHNNQDSSFWQSSNYSGAGNISGLGFDGSGTKISGIPGLGDAVTHNHNDGEKTGLFPPEAIASSSNETLCSAAGDQESKRSSFDAKAIWPEMYNSPKVLPDVSHKERCRNILNSLNISSSKEAINTEIKSCKISEDYSSDDDQSDSPLHVSHHKQNSDSDSSDSETSLHQDAEVAYSEKSPEDLEKEKLKLSTLLFAHLCNVIQKVSSAPKVDNKKNPLPVLNFLKDSLQKSQILDMVPEDIETSQPENVEQDTDACPTPQRSNSRELDVDEMSDNNKAVGANVNSETLSPTKDMQCTNFLLDTKSASPKVEASEVNVSEASLKPELEEQLDMKTAPLRQLGTASPRKQIASQRHSFDNRCRQANSRSRSPDSVGSSNSDVKRSLSSSVVVRDNTNVLSALEKSPDSPPPRSRSSSSEAKSPVAGEADLLVEKPPESPRKYDRSPENDTPLELNTVTEYTIENIDSPTNESAESIDTKSGSQWSPHKDTTEEFTQCSGVTDAVDQKLVKLPEEETVRVSDSLPSETTDFDTPAAVNTTISVNSNGKIYLADVPLMALSYARDKILSEINKLGEAASSDMAADTEVASPPKSPTSELTCIDIDESMCSPQQNGSAAREIEEGEISSSSDSEKKKKLLGESKKLKKIGSGRKRKRSYVGKNDFKNERRKLVKYDTRDSIRKDKSHSKTDNGNKIKQPDLYPKKPKLNADIIYINSDSEADHPANTNKKEKTIFDKMYNLAGQCSPVSTASPCLSMSITSNDGVDDKKGVTSKVCQNESVFINSSKKQKSGHEIDPQVKKSDNKVKNIVKKKETAISDYLRGLDNMSESDLESEVGDMISATRSDTALLKPSSAAKQSTALHTSQQPGSAVKCGQAFTEASEKLRKFSIFGENIIVQVFNEKPLLKKGDQNMNERISSKIINLHSDNVVQSDNSMPKTYNNVPLNLDTAETSGKVSGHEVILLGAEKTSSRKSSGSSSSLMVAKKKCHPPKQTFCSLVKKIKCESKELLTGVSLHVPTNDQKLVLSDKILLQVQKQAKQPLSATEICQNTHKSTSAEVQSKEVQENQTSLIYRKLIHKPEHSLKPEPTKRCYRDRVKHSETETESDRADSLKPGPTQGTNTDRVRLSGTETETDRTDSYSDRDTYRKSLSPYSSDAKRRRTDRSSDRSSPYSRKRKRRSSSSSSYSKNRSLSSRSRDSRSSSPLSRDSRSYHRSRHYRRDEQSSSSSYYRRRSRSPSSSPYSRRKRRSSSRYSSRKYSHRYRKSVSSSRSRDSSTSDGYRRYRSKSPRRYSRSGSYSSSPKRSSGFKKSYYTKADYYSSKSKNDKLWTLMNQTVDANKPKNQHPFDMLYSITNSTQKPASNTNTQSHTLPHTSGAVNVNDLNASKHVCVTATITNVSTQNYTGITSSFSHTSIQNATVDTGSITSAITKTDDIRVLENDTSSADCQKVVQAKDGVKVDEMNTTVGKDQSVIDTEGVVVVGKNLIADKARDHEELLRSHRQAQSDSSNSRYIKTHNVTVKQLIISQLGLSITDKLKSNLPYSLHTVLSDRHLSREERRRRCMETIQCCIKHHNIPTELVSKMTIEPVINTFGNPPFEDRLEHFPDEQILLEVNVIKKCQYILEQQQGQVKMLSSFIKLHLGSQLTSSMIFEPGTYSGEPLPTDLQVSVRGFAFIVPKEVIDEEIALAIKDSLEISIECILELIKSSDFGREHFRVPEILLLEEEKFQRYSRGNCFLMLNKSLPKKVFTRLLTIKNRIESLKDDTKKNNEEKYSCSRQLIGERLSVLLSHIGNITHKRVSKLRTLYNQLQDCEAYMRKVIGPEGLHKLPLFYKYMCAVRHHYDTLNREYINPSYSEYYD